MAGEQHLIVAPDHVHPWTLLFEVAGATQRESWVLVGGLMVHAHAVRAGVVPSRPTGDVDLLLNVGAVQVSAVAGPLQARGFRPLESNGVDHLHRFVRGDDIVDVMVERGARARWAQRAVFQAPAARQAIERRDWYELRGATRSVVIGVPDALGAIVAKGAAYAVDQRDRNRHLEDLAVLFASSGGRRALQLERLQPRDKQHLRPAIQALADGGHDAWGTLAADDRVVGQRAHAAIEAAIQ